MPELQEILKEGIVKVRYSGSKISPSCCRDKISFSLAGKAGSGR